MSFNRNFSFGMPVTSVSAGYYPFELQVWAFAGQSDENSDEWIVNLQGWVRCWDHNGSQTGQGFNNSVSSLKVFGTNNVVVTLQASATEFRELVIYEQQHPLVNIAVNVLHPDGNSVQHHNEIKFKLSAGNNSPSPISIDLVDVQLQTTLNLLGSTEVVVIDPIFALGGQEGP